MHCVGRIVKCEVEKLGKKESCELEPEKTPFYAKSKQNITLKPGERVSIVTIIEQTFTRGYVFETHFTNHPIINLNIMVNFPPDFEFNLENSFSSECRLKLNEDGVKEYNVSGGIFRGQGIEFICQPKSKKGVKPTFESAD